MTHNVVTSLGRGFSAMPEQVSKAIYAIHSCCSAIGVTSVASAFGAEVLPEEGYVLTHLP